jgi:hypothetical protein
MLDRLDGVIPARVRVSRHRALFLSLKRHGHLFDIELGTGVERHRPLLLMQEPLILFVALFKNGYHACHLVELL